MKPHRLKMFLIFLWLVFTLSMAGWWVVFTLRLIKQPPEITDVARLENMILWEGLAWIVLLLISGMALVYYVMREQRQVERFKAFVASFSHDLKTSLASLRLQAESLKEDLGETSGPLVSRLVADTVRLQLQLENSLFLAHGASAHGSSQKLYYETIRLSDVLRRMEHSWPQIKIHLSKDMDVHVDDRAMSSILKNIIHNAVIHGQANEIFVEVLGESQLSIRDNGMGFSGDVNQLGQMFYRHNPSSGSGMGLYIVSRLMKDMGGRISFPKSDRGFCVNLEWGAV